MPKRVSDERKHLAPDILGYMQAGKAIIIDERNSSILDPYKTNDKIVVYERQVKDWFLNIAYDFTSTDKKLSQVKYGFVSLMVGISYIEGVQQYKQGLSSRNRSAEFFRKGMRDIFNLSTTSNEILNRFYSDARCGLFHNGMSEGSIVLNYDASLPVEFSAQEILVNPYLFIDKIRQDFDEYIVELKDESNRDLRANFDRMFSNL